MRIQLPGDDPFFAKPPQSPIRTSLTSSTPAIKEELETTKLENYLSRQLRGQCKYETALEEAIRTVVLAGKFQSIIQLIIQKPKIMSLIQHPCLSAFWEKALHTEDNKIINTLKGTLKPHRFDDQSEKIPDQRSPFAILAGTFCFKQSRGAATKNEEDTWLQRGLFFRDYQSMQIINHQHVTKIKSAVHADTDISLLEIRMILDHAEKTAKFHAAAGYGLLAHTCFRLGRYFDRRLLKKRGLNSHPEDQPGTSNDPESMELPDPDSYLAWRNSSYLDALKFITVAIKLEPYCSNITYNATLGTGLMKCPWTYSNLPTLVAMQEYFKELLLHTIVSPCIETRISEGIIEAENIYYKQTEASLLSQL